MRGRWTVLILVTAWILALLGSYVFSTAIEGPRNIETGFKRLDVLFRWQLAALVLAFVSLTYAWIARPRPRWVRLLGFAPAVLTVLSVLVLTAAAVFGPGSSQDTAPGLSAPAARTTTDAG